MPAFVPYFFLLSGLFTIVAAAMNWDWFINNRKARLFVALFGRDGARTVYILLGIFLTGLGVAMATGMIDMSNGDDMDGYGHHSTPTTFYNV